MLRLADWMAHRSQGMINSESMGALRAQFSESEILELAAYFAVVTGFQKFNSVFRILYRCEE